MLYSGGSYFFAKSAQPVDKWQGEWLKKAIFLFLKSFGNVLTDVLRWSKIEIRCNKVVQSGLCLLVNISIP